MAILDVHSAGTVLQSKRAKVFILSLWEGTTRTVYGRAQQGQFMGGHNKDSLWEGTTRTVYGRAQQGRFMEVDNKDSLWEGTTRTVYGRVQQGWFMEEDSKHLYSFVGSHMLSHDLDVSLWLHFVN